MQDIYRISSPEAPGPDRGPRLGAGQGRRRLVFCIFFVYLLIVSFCTGVYASYGNAGLLHFVGLAEKLFQRTKHEITRP